MLKVENLKVRYGAVTAVKNLCLEVSEGEMVCLLGAVVGGYLLALIDVSFNYGLSQHLLHFRDAFTFTFVILIFLFRPSGLIKGREAGQRT